LDYIAGGGLQESQVAGADVVILMLGTNDAQSTVGFEAGQYSAALTELARKLMAQAQGATFLLAIPPPAVAGGSFTQYFDHNVINTVLPKVVPQVAASLGIECLDCFAPFGGANPNSQDFSDGIHLQMSSQIKVAKAVVGAVHRNVSNKGGAPAASMQMPGPNQQQPSAPTPVGGQYALPPNPRTVNNGIGSQNLGSVNNLMPTQNIQTMNNLTQPQNTIHITTVNNLVPSKNLQSVSFPQSAGGYEIGDAAQAAGGYYIGAAVDIYSKSAGSWFEGQVTGFEGTDVIVDFQSSDGKWKSKCMMPEHPELRLRGAGQPQAAGFVLDQLVEYYSPSLARWIEAQVIKVEPGGYQLDVKPGVTITAEKIRHKNSLTPSSANSIAPSSASMPGFIPLTSIPKEGMLMPMQGPNGLQSCTTFALN
jgi:hypothetical protein